LEKSIEWNTIYPGREFFYLERSQTPEERLEKEATSGIKNRLPKNPCPIEDSLISKP
jgi:hypothetical protein